MLCRFLPSWRKHRTLVPIEHPAAGVPQAGNGALADLQALRGVHQDLNDAPCDYIRLDLSAAD
jgi:hypothetical protein